MARTLDLDSGTTQTRRLRLPYLIIPVLLALIYGMLSFISLGDQAFFYESMDIPVPDNELWAGPPPRT